MGRLVAVGLASILPTASGVLLMDTPGYPQEYRTFYLAHAAGTTCSGGNRRARLAGPEPGRRLRPRRRSHRPLPDRPGGGGRRVSYADFAIALLDEIDAPEHHRTHLGVEAG